MKISNENPTNHVLIALMDYRVDQEFNKDNKCGFGYFEFLDTIIHDINHFLDGWEQGERNTPGIIIHIPEVILINDKYIYDQVDNDNTNFDGIKLDSINFLESTPDIGQSLMKGGKGYLLAFRNEFIIQCEDLVGHGISHSIYRCSVQSYWKINHLLKREKAI